MKITIAEIQEIMEGKDWNATRLASKCNLHQTTIQKWLDGTSKPNGAAVVLLHFFLRQVRKKRDETIV